MGIGLLMSFFLVDLTDAETAGRAEAAFREGVRLRHAVEEARPHFRAAAGYYEELHHRGVRNALIYRNLGNAYLLAGDLPRALFAYHRGLRVAPHNRDLEDCLTQARAKVIYPQGSSLGRPPPDGQPPWLPRPGPGWLFAIAVGSYTWTCAAATRWLMVRRVEWLAVAIGSFLVAALLAGLLVHEIRVAKADVDYPLIVIADDGVLLRKGNGLTYPPRYETPLNRGVEARLLFERGDWLQIELAGGEVGWVPRRYVLLDAPGMELVQ